jgi:hypothetical protein
MSRLPRSITSSDHRCIVHTPDLQEVIERHYYRIYGALASPMARYLSSDDVADDEAPAPAWYIPKTHEIYIHTGAAEVKKIPAIPRDVWATENKEVAKILGLLAHEVAHATISDRMTPVQIGAPRHSHLLSMLEEVRVENHAVRSLPVVRRFLRASFALILANLPDVFESKSHVAKTWALTWGRVLAGVATPDEAKPVDTAARIILGDDVIDALTDLLQETLTLSLESEHTRTRMVEICDEWFDLIGETPEGGGCSHGDGEGEGAGEPSEGEGGGKAEGDSRDEGGDGSTDESESGSEVVGWGRAGSDVDVPDEDDDEGGDRLTDEDAELMKALKRDLADFLQDEWQAEPEHTTIANAAEWAANVFGKKKVSTRLKASTPSTEARKHVVEVAHALSNLSLPAITKVAKHSALPPGHLRTREAVRASAERAGGRMVTAQPWKGSARRHSATRPIVMGIATDTSGSMKWAEDGVAEFAYVWTNAGHRVGARTAAVTFGDTVHRIAAPGQVMDMVVTKDASDGTEQFDHAAASLDGVLKLTSPGYAARILFVVSDACFVKGGEPDRAATWLRKMDAAGTHVIWIGDAFMLECLKDDSYSAYAHWLGHVQKTAKHLTIKSIGEVRSGRGRHQSVFDLLNETALDAIAGKVA